MNSLNDQFEYLYDRLKEPHRYGIYYDGEIREEVKDRLVGYRCSILVFIK